MFKIDELNNVWLNGGIVKGSWKINKNHELFYDSKSINERYRLKGRILNMDGKDLVADITLYQDDQEISSKILKITGHWKLNEKQNLIFFVERRHSKEDRLIFNGEWEVSPNNQIIYRYTQTQLKTKLKKLREITFQGYWDIDEDRRLTYSLEGSTDSQFAFRGTFQTKSVLAKKGEIRYQIGAKGERSKTGRTIVIFGKWKVSRDLALEFEIQYPRRKKRVISLQAQYEVTRNQLLKVALKTSSGKPLGFEVVWTKEDIQKNRELYLAFEKNSDDILFQMGLRWKW